MRRGWIAAAVGAVCAIAACGGHHGDAARSAEPTGCHVRVVQGVIPPWARGGFSQAEPRMPHVLGRSGEIAALLFGYPLTAPPRRTVNNKILWVARRPPNSASDLRIAAQRYVGGKPVGRVARRVVARGPGPSIIDLPAPGCWRLQLRWADRRDVLDLRYRRRPG